MAKLILVVVLACTLYGCASSNGSLPNSVSPGSISPDRHVIRLALAPYQDSLVPTLAQVKGWYKEEGLDVDIKMMAMTEMQEAIAAGAIDVAWNNIGSVISTHAKNPQCVYAYGFNIFDQGYALMIRPNGSLKPLSDFLPKFKNRADALAACAKQLKGHTIVTTSHTDMEQAVCTVVRRAKLDFAKDVTISDFNPDEGLAAFLSGTGDAYLGGIPQRTRLLKEGMIEMFTGSDFGSPEINGYITTEEYACDHLDDLLKLLHVWFRCANYVNNHMNESAAIIIAKLNAQSGAQFTIADFKKFWNHIEHYPPNPAAIQKVILDKNGSAYWLNRWQDCNTYFVDITKTIPAKVSPENVFIMPAIQEKYVAKYGWQ